MKMMFRAYSPGYVLLTASINFSSNPATMAPPTGTMKFLSVLCIKASTRPTLAAFTEGKAKWNRLITLAFLFILMKENCMKAL